MAFPIEVNLIPGLDKVAYDGGVGAFIGVLGHATANDGDSADGERSYESRTWQSAFVHFFVDHTKIEQVADINYVAYGAGHTANHKGFVQVELCQTTDPAKFAAAYVKYVWLLAKILHDKKLPVIGGETLMSHAEVSAKWHETNHTDPIAYLARFDKSWANVVDDVKAEYAKMDAPVASTPQPAAPAQPLYRVRKTPDDAKTQLGAYHVLESAKAAVDAHPGFKVFDQNGKLVYDPTPSPAPATAPVDYESDIIRIIVDGVQKVAVTGLTKAQNTAKSDYTGHIVLQAKSDGHEWDLGVINPPVQQPVVQPAPTPEPPKPAFKGTDIMGKSVATANQMNQCIRSKNPNAPLLADTYVKLEGIYGVRADIAFAQMCKETNFLMFGERVPFSANNPAGLGATDSTQAYCTFDSWDHGVEAQMQHLYGYACASQLPNGVTVYDQRFQYVHRGAAPYVEYLGINENPLHVGWASDPNYGQGILNVLAEILKAEDKPIIVEQPAPVQPPAQPVQEVPAQPVTEKAPQEEPANVSWFSLFLQFLINLFKGGKQ